MTTGSSARAPDADGERIRFCPACGEAEPFDRPVCSACGHRVQLATRSAPERAGAPCPHCAKERLATLVFCPHCGQASEAARAPEPAATAGSEPDDGAEALALASVLLALAGPLLVAAAVFVALDSGLNLGVV